VSFFFIILLVSCATKPGLLIPEGEEVFSLLPDGGRFYLWADAVQGRPLLERLSFPGLGDRNSAQIMDSTSALAAAVFPAGQGRSFYLAATGNFPSSRAKLSLRMNRDWEMQRSGNGNSYWYSERDRLALALGSKLALVSDSDPFDFSQKETPPPSFIEFHRGLALAGWLPSPSGSINNFLQGLGVPMQIPAEEFFFGALRLPLTPSPADELAGELTDELAGEFWEIVLKIKTPSEAQARSLLSLFSMARLFLQPPSLGPTDDFGLPELAAMLFAASPQQDGEFLTFRAGPYSESDMALLLSTFSVYSR
jgi:hypothetical protein